MYAFIALLAYLIDLKSGDPDWLYKRIWHPVVVIGKLAEWLEHRMNLWPEKPSSIAIGGLATLTLLGFMVLAAWTTLAGLDLLVSWLNVVLPKQWHLFIQAAEWALIGLLASSLIAHKGLFGFVASVQSALQEGGLKSGQRAVQHLVSRDASQLDETGVARSAIESLSENFSDAVVAPLFWLLIFGWPGLVAYKTINTMDSMWGYRNARFSYFGKVAARLDDVANWIPARLAALLVLLSVNRLDLLPAVSQNAPHHRSPNAGWPESAFAHVLQIKISGPRVYDSQLYRGTWMGQGSEQLENRHIEEALRLFSKCRWPVLIGLTGLTALELVLL